MRFDTFRRAKEAEIAALREVTQFVFYPGPRPDFLDALRPGRTENARNAFPALICEYKRASPSQGRIRRCQQDAQQQRGTKECAETLEPEEVVTAYARNGAAAISILTEQTYFDGDLSYLARARAALDTLAATTSETPFSSLPLLRKDFLFDPLQIWATAETPASAVLLIVGATSEATLATLFRLATELGMTPVVEVFTEEDLAVTRKLEAPCIQVNARNLETLTVDTERVLGLIRKHPPKDHETWIAASGMQTAEDLLRAKEAGYHACLLGTHLMRANDPGRALQTLLTPPHATS